MLISQLLVGQSSHPGVKFNSITFFGIFYKAFFGHGEENKKVLELNFTLGNTP